MNMPVEFALFFQYLHAIGNGWPLLVVIGVFAGVIARAMSAGPRNHSILVTCVLGIAGALLGAGTARWFGLNAEGPGILFLLALAGSLILVYLHNRIARRFRHRD